jgi:hypothetical protein
MTTQTFTMGSNQTLEIEHVGGDMIIEGREQTDLQAQGDTIHIEQTDGSFAISCDGELNLSIPHATKVAVTFVGGDLKADNLDGSLDVSFVGGDATFRNLKGQVSIAGMVGGDQKFENVSRISMGAIKNGVGPDISAYVRRKVEQSTRRAEQKVRRAESKIKISEHKLHRHGQIRANIDMGHWKGNVTPGSFTPDGKNQPVSDEERMTILKMLQEKKITSEQADQLLAALEDGE